MISEFITCVFFLSVSILIVGCGSSELTSGGGGGGSTETTNGIVFSTASTPAKGAIVRLVDVENWVENKRLGMSVVIDSTATDSNGYFSFPYVKYYENCNLQIDLLPDSSGVTSGEALVIQDYLSKCDSLNRFNLKHYASASGRFIDTVNTGESIELFGTTYSSDIKSDSFYLRNVAEGEYCAYVNIRNTIYCPVGNLALNAGQYINTFKFSPKYAFDFIDDFDSDSTRFGRYQFADGTPTQLTAHGISSWFKINTSPELDPVKAPFTVVKQYFEIDEGYSLVVAGIISNNTAKGRKGIGFTLGTGSNLSFVNTLSFLVQGKGILRVYFCSPIIDTLPNTDSVHFSYTFFLDDLNDGDVGWGVCEVPLRMLEVPDNSAVSKTSLKLADILKSISRIEFVFTSEDNSYGDNVWLYIDDLTFDYLM